MSIPRRRFTAALALLACARQGVANGAAGTQASARGGFPDVLLVNQHAQRIRFYDDLLQGEHITAINFIFTQCADICPATTANLARVQALLGERLGREVRMASISIDPVRDTPAILKAYAANFGARSGWQFLTGKPGDIEQVRRRMGAVERDARRDADRSQHTGMVIYGSEARGRWGRVSAMAEPARIFESITRWI
jgi:protein SCO1/2